MWHHRGYVYQPGPLHPGPLPSPTESPPDTQCHPGAQPAALRGSHTPSEPCPNVCDPVTPDTSRPVHDGARRRQRHGPCQSGGPSPHPLLQPPYCVRCTSDDGASPGTGTAHLCAGQWYRTDERDGCAVEAVHGDDACQSAA